MGRQCYICKIYSYQTGAENLSFHRFPVKIHRRNIWISVLGFEKDHQFPKQVEICSRHFQENDFAYREDGSRYLKQDAVPLPTHSVFCRQESTSSESTIHDSPTSQVRKYASPSTEVESQHSDATVPNPQLSQFEDIPAKKRLRTDPDEPSIFCIPGPSNRRSPIISVTVAEGIKPIVSTSSIIRFESSSDTLTASETEECIMLEKGYMRQKNTCSETTPKKRKRRYVGDLSSDDFSTPTKAKKNFRLLKGYIINQRKKIRSLQTTVSTLRKRIKTLNSLLKFLKDKSYITDASESILRASLSGSALEIFERMLKGSSRQKYNPALRSFALTLAFYSPKAYNFVRNAFNRSLPHLSTISKWYSSVDGSPGFTREAIQALKIKQEEASLQGRTLLCNLVLDEMSIRQQVEWTGTKFCGYVDIATKIDSDILPEAKEVLVFMLVCLNGSWKIPVGYFFLDGLTGPVKAELVKKCLTFVHDSGVIVTSLTFDGAPVNFTMASCLGANFSNIQNLKTHFSHPITGDNIFILLDPCHMIKLVRNTFGAQKYLTDVKNDQIKWDFLVKLVTKQNFEGLHLGTKIRIRHLQWAREKMKVKIATQTLSKSVADALLYLGKDLKLPEFDNVEPTANFIKKFNDLFDIFNSRNRFAKYFFKRPLSPATADAFFIFFDDIINYISSLKLGNISITQSPRKTGFLGFLICIFSLKGLYSTYVVEQKRLKYILTNKLSQDHLELFFGAIRGKGGFNNNPTARHFEAAYKRLLIHTEITGPDTGNITSYENLTILSCGSGQHITVNEHGDDMLETKEFVDFEEVIKKSIETYQFSSTAWDLTIYTEDVVAYIAGYIVRTLQKCITCSKCLFVLEDDTVSSLLQQRKRYGNLVTASQPVISICRAAEKYFRFFEKTTNIFNKNNKNLLKMLTNNCFSTLTVDMLSLFDHHLLDDDVIDGHVFSLIKLMLHKYFNLRIHHETVKRLDQTKKERIRSIYTKTILFRHQ